MEFGFLKLGIFEKISKFSLFIGTGFFLSTIAIEAKAIPLSDNTDTKVFQLKDVNSTDWAFQALQSLITKYGSLTGYPDGTFRGNQTMTRYEFAAVLQKISINIDRHLHTLTLEDLASLRRLQQEFAPQLALLSRRIDNLERRTDSITDTSFSTTTKLDGEVIFALTGVAGNNQANEDEDIDRNLTLGNRVRLNFDTSFYGEDRLRVRLQSTNLPLTDEVANTDMARLSFRGDDDRELSVSRLEYAFPLGDRVEVYLEGIGGSLNDYTNTFNDDLSGSGKGAVSRFGQRNPIYRQGDGAGIGISYEIIDAVNLDVGFVADEANDTEIGLGNAAYGAIAQLSIEPIDSWGIGLTYIRSYNSLDTGVGSQRANDPFDENSEAISANSFGVQSSWELNSNLTLGGWFGLTRATAEDIENEPSTTITNWAVTVAFPDLGGEGNLGGIVIGQPNKAIDNDFTVNNIEYVDPDNSLHLEAFYRLKVTDHIDVTPGFFVITNPEHNSDNQAIYIGTVRTTFSF
jgi:hypothetical protein